MTEIRIIKKNYKDVIFIFDFFDRFAAKLKLAAVKEKNDNTLAFLDYYDEEHEIYYVPIERINTILDYCYAEYFFKIVLSGSCYYQKVKKVSEDLEIEPYIFDLFFRSFFLAVKQITNSPNKNTKHFIRKFVYRTVARSHFEAFDNLPKIDHDYYVKKSYLLLEKLESLGLVSYRQNDITQDAKLKTYFPISCDTFKFCSKKELNDYEICMPMFDFLDLKRFLDNQDFLKKDLLTIMDRAIQTIIVISFKDAKFYNDEYSDNSYLKRLKLEKELVRKNKENA